MLGAGPALALKRKREEVADSESEEGEVGSEEEFGWRGGEGGLVEGVGSGMREGGDGVSGEGVVVGEGVGDVNSAEWELRDAMEEDVYNLGQGYDGV